MSSDPGHHGRNDANMAGQLLTNMHEKYSFDSIITNLGSK